MKIILDTNVLLNCIGKRTRYHLIWQRFIEGKLQLCESSEMLLEYEEIIKSKYPKLIAEQFRNFI